MNSIQKGATNMHTNPSFESLHIGQEVWITYNGGVVEKKKIATLERYQSLGKVGSIDMCLSSTQDYIEFEGHETNIEYSTINLYLVEPVAPMIYWQWKIKSSKGGWYRIPYYYDDHGWNTEGVTYRGEKNWDETEKIKIEDDFIIV